MQHSGRTSPVGEDMEVSVNVSVVTVAVDSERAFLIRIPFDFLYGVYHPNSYSEP